MDNKRLRAGLIGAGNISEHHVAGIRRSPHAELVGAFDLDPTKAKALAERFSVRAFSSLSEMRDAGIDVVHVLTPPASHAAVALQALDAGFHVFVEKPLGTDVDDCLRVRDKAKAVGRTVGVCHSLLWDPQVRGALEAVRAGAIGDVVSVDILRSSLYPPWAGGAKPPQYQTAGYPFRDIGIHCLYLLEAFLGPVSDVQATWASLGGDPNLAFDEWRAQVRCQRGLGQFQLSWNVKPVQSQIILQGTRGVLRVDLFLMFKAGRRTLPLPKPAERIVNACTDSIGELTDVTRNVIGFARGQIRPFHGLQDLVVAFYDALAKGAPPPVSIDDAISAVRWTEHVARQADADHAARTQVSRGNGVSAGGQPLVLVTGAAGGLGSALVERLRADGHTNLRLFQRRPVDNAPAGTHVVTGDLGDADAVDRAVAGADLVYHVGATMKGDWNAHLCGTVTGTQNVVDACLKHKVRKLVHVSSLSVIDWASGPEGGRVDEATAFEPRAEERGSYTRAKLMAETIVADAVKLRGLPAVIVRPGQIFGRRLPLMTAAVARKAGPRLLTLGDGEIPLPLVYIDDVVDALVQAAHKDLPAGTVIQVVDTTEVWTQNLVVNEVLGANARVIHVPRPVVFAAGKLSELMLKPLGKASPLNGYRLKSALAKRAFASDAAETLLGWKPRVGVREGIRRGLAERQPS